MAHQQKVTAGTVISNLVREALQPRSFIQERRNGIPILPRRPHGPTITTELVNRLRGEDE